MHAGGGIVMGSTLKHIPAELLICPDGHSPLVFVSFVEVEEEPVSAAFSVEGPFPLAEVCFKASKAAHRAGFALNSSGEQEPFAAVIDFSELLLSCAITFTDTEETISRSAANSKMATADSLFVLYTQEINLIQVSIDKI